MTITPDDMLLLLPGQRAIISACEAAEHGDNSGCVCSLKGQLVTIGPRYETPFVGTPSWHLQGLDKTVRLAEITLVREG